MCKPDIFDATYDRVVDKAPEPSDLEQRIKTRLAQLMPPGTKNTPETQTLVKREVHTILSEEFTRMGLPAERTAPLLAMLVGALRITAKEPTT